MAADYDAPRLNDQDEPSDIIPARATVDVLEVDGDEEPTLDLSLDDSPGGSVIIPLQSSEFVCSECFLVISRLRLHHGVGRDAVCEECAGSR